MNIMKYLILALTLMSSAISAQSGEYYDPNTGNFYYWHPALFGTDVYGSNPSTGSTWNTHILEDGSMMGIDADGNAWIYNVDTELYTNSGTGKICHGLGDLRECF